MRKGKGSQELFMGCSPSRDLLPARTRQMEANLVPVERLCRWAAQRGGSMRPAHTQVPAGCWYPVTASCAHSALFFCASFYLAEQLM